MNDGYIPILVYWGSVQPIPKYSKFTVEQAEKAVEESKEVVEAVKRYLEYKDSLPENKYDSTLDKLMDETLSEMADVIIALSNLAAGAFEFDLHSYIRMCEIKNAQRGRYPQIDDEVKM